MHLLCIYFQTIFTIHSLTQNDILLMRCTRFATLKNFHVILHIFLELFTWLSEFRKFVYAADLSIVREREAKSNMNHDLYHYLFHGTRKICNISYHF